MDELTCTKIERAIFEQTGVPYRAIRDVMKAFNEIMTAALVEGKSVRLGHIGRLYTAMDKSRIRYNVATKEVRKSKSCRRLKLIASTTIKKLLRSEEVV